MSHQNSLWIKAPRHASSVGQGKLLILTEHMPTWQALCGALFFEQPAVLFLSERQY
jgi:hypothetical protein